MITKRIKIYLSHSSHEQDRGLKIQQILEDDGYPVANPFDVRGLSGNENVRNDIMDILNSNVVVCLYPHNLVTVGIDQEMVYASLFRKYVITYITKVLRDHCWIQYHSDVILPPGEERNVLDVLNKFLGIVETVQEKKK